MRVLPLLGLLIATSADGQGKPPLRLVLDQTIDARTGVTLGNLTALDIGLDGTVAVVDEGNGAIYRFTPAGKLRDSLSRKGRGPGEFLESAGIALGPAGEIALADLANRRLTFWNPAGRLVGSAALTGGTPVGLFWRGADPVLGRLFYSDSTRVEFAPVQFGNGKSAGTVVGRFSEPGKDQRAAAVSCGSCHHTLTGDGRILVAAPDTAYLVSEVNGSGRVVRQWFRTGVGPGQRTPEEAARLDAKVLAGPGSGRPAPEGSPKNVPGRPQAYRPRFQGIGLDARGRLLALVSNQGSNIPVLDVFTPQGKFAGTVALPMALRSLVVRGGRVAALGETPEGAPAVYVFHIEEVP